jgi:small subunit ribosomal protein S17
MAFKKLVGTVTSNKLAKTVTVRFDIFKKDPKYGKNLARRKTVLAHLPEEIKVNLGDLVVVVPCRPISARKHFKVVEVVAK